MARRGNRYIPPVTESKRKPTHEELHIWDYVTRDDTRLPDAKIDWQAVERTLQQERRTPLQATEIQQTRVSDDVLDSLVKKTAFTAAGAAHPALPDHKGGVDRNSARRLRQGKLPIEATLDMHGMVREEAQQQLTAFIQRSYDNGKRCVLVITGKGRFQPTEDGREAGVLKRALPRWLTQPPIASLVLRYETAQPQHGGEGAVYILLRRQR